MWRAVLKARCWGSLVKVVEVASAKSNVYLGLAIASLLFWGGMILLRGGFWRANQRLCRTAVDRKRWPAVSAIVPARNEAESVFDTIEALMRQDYPGSFSITLIDDNSEDGTAELARTASDGSRPLRIISGKKLAPGWTGKLWALSQGLEDARAQQPDARYYLLTDADIVLKPDLLRRLVAKAEDEGLDLVSLMAMLHCFGFWERLLMPAFVFFFQMVYPFSHVNNRGRPEAAAAGGCMLVRAVALDQSGGLSTIRNRFIDDCALAAELKRNGPIWIGLGASVESRRVYRGLAEVWSMVARTAFEQLNHSAARLIGTVAAMGLLFVMPPLSAIGGIIYGNAALTVIGGAGWLAMVFAYRPTLLLYRQPPVWDLTLPVAGLLFTLMTVDSACRRWTGYGGRWKGRSYQRSARS